MTDQRLGTTRDLRGAGCHRRPRCTALKPQGRAPKVRVRAVVPMFVSAGCEVVEEVMHARAEQIRLILARKEGSTAAPS